MLDGQQLPKKGDEAQRAFSFAISDETRESIAETRKFDISLSSEEPVDRWFGTEILVHDTKSVDLKFLNSGAAPLLLDHDRRRQIGVIEKAWLDGKKVRATVRLSRSALAQEILDDVVDGIRSNVSVGYRIHETVVKENKGEKPDEARITSWSPYEASIVAIPADTSVGIGRATQEKQEYVMPDPVVDDKKPAAQPGEGQRTQDEPKSSTVSAQMPGQGVREITFSESEAADRARAAASERATEVVEIMELGARHNMRDKANEFVKDGKSLREFAGYVRQNIPDDKPLVNQNIGMNREETSRFSLVRLANAYVEGAGQAERLRAASFEIDAINAAAEAATAAGIGTRGARLPQEVMDNWIVPESTMGRQMAQRALSVANDGDLVPQDYRAQSFIDVLRSLPGPTRVATMLQGLSGDVDIPKKLTASAPAWVSAEGGNAAESEPTFGLVSLRPKDIAVYTDMTRRMRQQASPDIENLVRMDILAGMALGIDLGAIEGTGAAGQPEGVLNVTGVNKPASFAGVNPTWAEVVALETAVAEDNALMGTLAYLGRANMRGALKTTTKDAGSGQFVMPSSGELNGYAYLTSNQMTDGNLYFGNWADLLIGMWGTLDLMIDPYALAQSGGLRMIAFQTVDTAVRHAQSFAYNNDGV